MRDVVDRPRLVPAARERRQSRQEARESVRLFHAGRPGSEPIPNRPETERQPEGSTMTGSTDETPVLDLLGRMTADSLEASSLDDHTLMLVRIAALAAVDAPPGSYLLNLGAAADAGVDADEIRGVLAAIAPIVGTARIVSATGSIVEALDVAIESAEVEEQG
jgi:alkylhydroperoxidase/carboxymuconolactone decarboxylase family protein YurZ